MRKIIFSAVFSLSLFSVLSYPQSVPRGVPIKEGTVPDRENEIPAARIYTNRELGFEVTFPELWLLPEDDFEEYMRSQGFDLGLKPPEELGTAGRIQVQRALKRVTILATAFRAMPGSEDNAILRISIEDLTLLPEIKDAVDYFDVMRSQFARLNLPPDFKYSETQAERLGKMQFAFLDTSSNAGKKRMYATVRKGVALMFTLSYTKDGDLQAVRKTLAEGRFDLKP